MTADVDVAESDMEEWMQNADNAGPEATSVLDASAAEADPASQLEQTDDVQVNITTPTQSDESAEEAPPRRVPSGLLARRQAANPGSPELHTVNSIDMPGRRSNDVDMSGGLLSDGALLSEQQTRTETPDIAEQIIAGEGPLTPRNNAGPFVFDGSAGRASLGSGRRVVAISEATE